MSSNIFLLGRFGVLPHMKKIMRGISLIELMIAMAVGLMVLLAMTTIFINNSQSRRELDKSAFMLENGRYAIQILRDDLQLAGYMDALSVLPVPSAAEDIVTAPCATTLSEMSGALGLAVIGRNSGQFDCLSGAVTTTGTLFVQRAATEITAADDRIATRRYIQVSFCGDEYEASPSVLDMGNAATFILRPLNCTIGSAAPTRELIRRFYYIDSNNVSGDGIPTLKRIDQGGSAEALVEGIEAMRFEFVLDADGDGSPDTWAETPGDGDWPDVVGVRIWVLARALDQTAGYASSGPDKSFNLGSITITPNDNYKRHVFTSYVELLNPAGRRQK